MAYDEGLADRLRTALSGMPEVEERRMFGGLAFLVDGSMVAAAGSEGRLLARCLPSRTEELLRRPGATRATMGTRTMSAGWITVDAAQVADDEALAPWVREGLAVVGR